MSKRVIIRGVVLACVVGLIALTIGIYVHYENRSIGYGSTLESVSLKRKKNDCCKDINPEGLVALNSYGSGLINYHDFKSRFKDNRDKIYVVNLFPEDIYYYNDRCLKWYGLGYTQSTLGNNAYAKKPIRGFFKPILRFFYGYPPVDDLKSLKTEEQIIHEMGGHYFMPLRDNTNWLNSQGYLEETIQFFESLPNDAIVYFHCFHGKGRTTTFMILYDIFRNHKKVPLIDIVNRHYCLGREDVFNTVVYVAGSWSEAALLARKKLVEHFYEFMNDPKGYHHQSWAQWNASKGYTTSVGAIHRGDEKK